MRFILRGCVLTIEEIFLPVLDVAGEDRFGKRGDLAALQSNISTLKQGTPKRFRLRIAIKEFNLEI